MSVNDALPYPIYNCKYREYIELVDTNGDPVALASGDTELGKDSATLADATNEMSEGSTGYCSIDFTYSEMAYNCVLVVPKSAGAVTRAIKLFPARLPVLRSGTAQAGAAGSITLDSGASSKDGAYVGCWVRGSNNTPAGIQGEVRKITGYTGSTKVATVAPNWDNTPSSSTTFEILVPGDMSISTLLADEAGIADAVWDEALIGTKTARQIVGVTLAAFAAGKVSGGGTTTVTFRDTEDGFDAIVMTVDANGNRSSVTLNFSA